MNNKITNIQQARELLDLWYQGNTTPEQEDLLYDFFTSSNNIPEDLRAEALIFGHTSDTPVPQASRRNRYSYRYREKGLGKGPESQPVQTLGMAIFINCRSRDNCFTNHFQYTDSP